MKNKDSQLHFLKEMISKKELGDYFGMELPEDDPFLQEVKAEYDQALSVYRSSLGDIIDKLISHLSQ